MNVPIKRLAEYKRKIININENTMIEAENPSDKRDKVTYPMPKKIQPPEEIHDEQLPLNP